MTGLESGRKFALSSPPLSLLLSSPFCDPPSPPLSSPLLWSRSLPTFFFFLDLSGSILFYLPSFSPLPFHLTYLSPWLKPHLPLSSSWSATVVPERQVKDNENGKRTIRGRNKVIFHTMWALIQLDFPSWWPFHPRLFCSLGFPAVNKKFISSHPKRHKQKKKKKPFWLTSK